VRFFERFGFGVGIELAELLESVEAGLESFPISDGIFDTPLHFGRQGVIAVSSSQFRELDDWLRVGLGAKAGGTY
jgi:hypothetical protein